MRQVWLRASFVIAMLGVAAAAAYQVVLTEQRLDRQREAERAFEALGWELTVSLADLRAAQRAYVAAGQDRDYWMRRATEQFEIVGTALSNLAATATATETIVALDETRAALEDLSRMDARTRDHSVAGQDLMASDLIFTDGLELARNASDHVTRARTAERDARDAAATAGRRTQGFALAAALGTALLVALGLLPLPRQPTVADVHPESDEPSADAAVGTTLGGRREGRLLLDLELDPDSAQEANAAPPDPVHGAEPIVEPTPDLRLAADLCTDLGRLSSTTDLPALLARAAQILNARGVIVWVRDESGAALRPAIAHGYRSTALARLGRIACDSDNATAAALRDGRLQIVRSDNTAAGAIVAPLVSTTSCPGVVSIELDDGWESNSDVQSTAVIIAAQLATLIVADSSSSDADSADAVDADAVDNGANKDKDQATDAAVEA